MKPTPIIQREVEPARARKGSGPIIRAAVAAVAIPGLTSYWAVFVSGWWLIGVVSAGSALAIWSIVFLLRHVR